MDVLKIINKIITNLCNYFWKAVLNKQEEIPKIPPPSSLQKKKR